MINENNGPDPVPYTGQDKDTVVPMIGRATPKPPHESASPASKPMHQHEYWQLEEKADGSGKYCKACGDDVPETQAFELKTFHDNRLRRQEEMLRLTTEVKTAQTTVVDELIDGRRAVYGEPTVTFPQIAQVWSGITGHEIHAYDVPLMMIGAKLVRAAQAPDYSDNSDDVEGFLAIFRELVGDDMVHARTVEEYLNLKRERRRGR